MSLCLLVLLQKRGFSQFLFVFHQFLFSFSTYFHFLYPLDLLIKFFHFFILFFKFFEIINRCNHFKIINTFIYLKPRSFKTPHYH